MTWRKILADWGMSDAQVMAFELLWRRRAQGGFIEANLDVFVEALNAVTQGKPPPGLFERIMRKLGGQ